MLILVLYGSEYSCTLVKISCAISGDGICGMPIFDQVRFLPTPSSTG